MVPKSYRLGRAGEMRDCEMKLPMETETLPNLEMLVSQVIANALPLEEVAQSAYLSPLAALPDRGGDADADHPQNAPRQESARLAQIEHALAILASVVARLAKEAQHSRLLLRATEHDPGLLEERRVQMELVRSMQARLNHVEERMDRQIAPPVIASPENDEIAEQLVASLTSIRDSLAALGKRRAKSRARSEWPGT